MNMKFEDTTVPFFFLPLKRCLSRILFLAITSFYRRSCVISSTPNDRQTIPNIYLQPLPQLSTGQTASARYSKIILPKLNSLILLLYPFFQINELHYYPLSGQRTTPLIPTLLTNSTDPCSAVHFFLLLSLGIASTIGQPLSFYKSLLER